MGTSEATLKLIGSKLYNLTRRIDVNLIYVTVNVEISFETEVQGC